MTYPTLVERYDDKHRSDAVVCLGCGASVDWDPAEGDPDDMCAEHTCGGVLTYRWVEGDKCKSCGKLNYSQPVDGCCSRRCALQAEYAATLAPSSQPRRGDTAA